MTEESIQKTQADTTPDIVINETSIETPKVMTETVEQIEFTTQQHSPFESIPNFHRAVSGYSTWTKVIAIFLFIGAAIYGLYALFSFILAAFNPLFIFIPFFLLAFTGLIIYIGILIWKSSNQISKLQTVQNQSEFNLHTIQGIDLLRKAIKIYIISILGLIVVMFLATIVGFAVFGYLYKDLGLEDTQKNSLIKTKGNQTILDLEGNYNLPTNQDPSIDFNEDFLK